MQKTPTDSDATLNAWIRIINATAHDLTDLLVPIRMMNQTLADILPALKQGYILALENNLMPPHIDQRQLEIADTFPPSIEKNVLQLIEWMSLERSYTHMLNTEAMKEMHSVQAYVDELLKTYPFRNEAERALVNVRTPIDFKLQCAPLFIESLLTQLLAFSLSNIEDAGKGEVQIWTETEGEWNTLHFKDTGMGVSLEALISHCERPLSKHNDDLKPGIAICRLAVMLGGGEMKYSSTRGGETTFAISQRNRVA